MKIPDDKLKTVCKIGEPDCCRYLGLGEGGFECVKHTSMRAMIDERVEKGTMRAVGDNCEGMVGEEETVYRPPTREERRRVEPLLPPKKVKEGTP